MALQPSRLPVSIVERNARFNQRGIVVWLTGLSGAGKTTIATAVERELFDQGKFTYLLDGDSLREGLNSGLGFSAEDRAENIRRAAHVARLFQQAGFITLASFISPTNVIRAIAREIIGEDNFIEVYVKASLETCIQRDPKGFYKQALQTANTQYTGLSKTQAYEPPIHPDLILDTEVMDLPECVRKTILTINQHGSS